MSNGAQYPNCPVTGCVSPPGTTVFYLKGKFKGKYRIACKACITPNKAIALCALPPVT